MNKVCLLMLFLSHSPIVNDAIVAGLLARSVISGPHDIATCLQTHSVKTYLSTVLDNLRSSAGKWSYWQGTAE